MAVRRICSDKKRVVAIAFGAICTLVAGACLYAVASRKKQNENNLEGDDIMPKFKLIFDGEEQDEIFDTEEDAEEHALYLRSCTREGAEGLHMSNPGDYDYDEDEFESPEYEIVEVDD